MVKVGDFAHFTKAHGHKCECWVRVRSYRDVEASTGAKCYTGKVVAGESKNHWQIGSYANVYDPPEQSNSWIRGWVRYTIVPEDEVPDHVWAEIAKQALLCE